MFCVLSKRAYTVGNRGLRWRADRIVTCCANRTRANYPDLHDGSSSALGIFNEGYRAKRPAQASIEISSLVTTHDHPMKIPAPKLMRSATANGLNDR